MPLSKAPSTNAHLDRIDVLRAIAIILVFLFHAQIALYPEFKIRTYDQDGLIEASSNKELMLKYAPTAFGWSGVQLFLLISGFLIHLGYLRNEGVAVGDRNYSFLRFFSKRFWRIYPPYMIALLFFCFSIYGNHFFKEPEAGWSFVTHALLIHNLDDSTFFSINPSFWSIALEMQLYAVYPALLLIRKIMGINKTFVFTLVLAGSIMAYRNIFYPYTENPSFNTSVMSFWYIWCAGAFLAEHFHEGKRVFATNGSAVVSFLILFLAMTVSITWKPVAFLKTPLAVFAWLGFFEWFMHVKLPIGTMRSWPVRLLIGIGLSSYSIYLIHQPYLKELLFFFGRYDHAFALPLKVGVAFLVIALIGYSMFVLIEQPSIAYGAKLRNRRKQQVQRSMETD